ncbi:MAG: oligosaccharide flippase family protein, partial [Anaerolineae bacterium]|nr:oligosaccharide flippase family protein [Anaerolineae bacterium]
MKSLGRNTATLLVSNIGSTALSFILSVLIGRALGQSGLGVYAAAMAWTFPLSLVVDFGLSTLITREVAQSPDATHAYLRAGTLARLWLGGGLMLATFLAAPILSQDVAVVAGIQVSTPLIIILPFFGLFTAVFRARGVMWPIPWLNLGMLAAQVALTAAVFLLGGGVGAALVVNMLTSAGQLAAAWWLYRRVIQNDTSTYPASVPREGGGVDIRSLLRLALPFALAGLLAALGARLNTILLEQWTNPNEVGYYTAAARFVEAGRMIPNALFGALFPLLASLTAQPDAMRRTFRRVLLGLAAFGGAAALAGMLLADSAIRLTYGESFAAAVPVLQLALLSLLPGLLRGGLSLYIYARGGERLVNSVTAAMLIVQLMLGALWIPASGAYGAALVSLIAEIIALALLWWLG